MCRIYIYIYDLVSVYIGMNQSVCKIAHPCLSPRSQKPNQNHDYSSTATDPAARGASGGTAAWGNPSASPTTAGPRNTTSSPSADPFFPIPVLHQNERVCDSPC